MTTKKDDKSSWAIGGMTLVGVGVNYINLGTWLNEPSFGLFFDGEFKMINWK